LSRIVFVDGARFSITLATNLDTAIDVSIQRENLWLIYENLWLIYESQTDGVNGSPVLIPMIG
jgi:hypothetical protein